VKTELVISLISKIWLPKWRAIGPSY